MNHGLSLLFLCIYSSFSLVGQNSLFPILTDTVVFEKVSQVALTEQNNNTLLCDKSGYIWVGSNVGLYRFDGYNWLKFEQPQTYDNQAIDPATTGILEGQKGAFWRASHKSGLVHFNYENRIIENIRPGDSTGFQIHNIMSDDPYWLNKDTLLLKTMSGFFIYNVLTSKLSPPFIPYPDSISNSSLAVTKSSYFGNAIRGIEKHRTEANKIWLTTAKELLLFDIATEEFEKIPIPFFNSGINRPIAPIDVIDMGNELIVTTWGAGIATYDLKTLGWSNVLPVKPQSEDVGLYNAIHNLSQLKDDMFIYAGSDHIGLYNHDLKTASAFIINDEHQLGHFTNVIVDHHGVIWALCFAGVFRSKHALFPTAYQTPLNITECSINGEYQNLDKSSGKVVLNVPLKGNISIKVAKLNPIDPEHFSFEYRLKGQSHNWQKVNPTEAIVFDNLAGGSYDFEVKVKSPGTDPTILSLATITFEMYFYEKLLFKLSLAFILGLGLIWYFISRTKKIRSEERLRAHYENQIVRTEMQALRSQMNPHFIFNSLNSIKNYVVNKGSIEAADYLTKFSQLVRIILENSKSELLNLDQEIKALRLYIEIENKRFKDKFEFDIDIDVDIDTSSFKIPPMLIQPFIENAIWHGLMHKSGNRKLLVKFFQLEDGILCIIEDNGIGRKASSQIGAAKLKTKKSLGTAITNDRIEAINKIHDNLIHVEIEDLYEKNQPSGTRVKVFIGTTKYNHYK